MMAVRNTSITKDIRNATLPFKTRKYSNSWYISFEKKKIMDEVV